jgi:hypothetical protein
MEQDNPVSQVPISDWTLATQTRPFERRVYLFRCASCETPQSADAETGRGWDHASDDRGTSNR